MSRVVVLGTDTDVGKTAFSLAWLHAFPQYAYWKPLETGPSDTGTIRSLAPHARVQEPIARFQAPLAPPLSARQEGRTCPPASEILEQVPSGPVLIETFGSPFSPLNDTELQIEWIRKVDATVILVSSSALGCIGRTIQALDALLVAGVRPAMVALLGPPDAYAEAELRKHRPGIAICSLPLVNEWNMAAFAAAGQQLASQAIPLEARPVTDAAELLTRDRQCIWHPYTSLQPTADPLPVVAARDEYLILADGREIIDAVSSWWTILHGHRHPVLTRALAEASATLDHVLFAGVTHPAAVTLAERLLKTTPWTGGRVFYSDDGSTAVEVALKMAYQTWCHRGEPGRQYFVSFEGAYHGDTFGAMSIGRDRLFFGTFEPLLFDVRHIPVDPAALDDLLRREGSQIAAVIIEPLIQAAGGMRMHTPALLRELYTVARKHGVLFIADEIMTGNRTGARWAFQHAGIVPDLICAGKTLTGGMMPLSATLASPEIVAAFDTADRARTFFHGHSFTAHPLACAVAAACEEMLTATDTHARARSMGEFWDRALSPLRAMPHVVDLRICGSVAAIEINAPGGYLADVGATLRETGLAHGVLLRPLGNVLYAMPPLGIRPEALQRVADAMAAAVRAVAH